MIVITWYKLFSKQILKSSNQNNLIYRDFKNFNTEQFKSDIFNSVKAHSTSENNFVLNKHAPKKIKILRGKQKPHFIKGYLRYKTITSQNMPSKAQIKNFFIS